METIVNQKLTPLRKITLDLRKEIESHKESTMQLIDMTNAFVFFADGETHVTQIDSPKKFDAIMFYFLDSFEHIYFNVINYCLSSRNLRQVNRSFYWIHSDYKKWHYLPEVKALVVAVNTFYSKVIEGYLLRNELYEYMPKFNKAVERVKREVESLKE